MNTTQAEYPRTSDPIIYDAIVLDEPWFDVVKLLKIVGIEFWHHLLLSLATVAWLPRLVGPLATIISGERYPSSIWTNCGAALLLLSYGFFIGKSSKGYRITRILVQSSFYVVVAMLLVAITPASVYTSATTVAWIVGSLAAGALSGCCFVSTKAKPAKAKKTGFMAVALIGVRLAVGFAVGIGALYLLMSLGTVAQSTLYVDKPAPETPFATANGGTWTFDEHKGKVILVEFWAPYCGPCVAAFPELKQTHERFSRHDDFEMVSVTSASMEEWAIEMFEDKQAPWTLLFRPEEAGPNDLAPYSIPAAYIIDRDGKVVAAHIRGAAVERELEKLFDE